MENCEPTLTFPWQNSTIVSAQDQYLRRIRVPHLKELDPRLAQEFAAAFEARDVRAATRAELRAYGIREIPG